MTGGSPCSALGIRRHQQFNKRLTNHAHYSASQATTCPYPSPCLRLNYHFPSPHFNPQTLLSLAPKFCTFFRAGSCRCLEYCTHTITNHNYLLSIENQQYYRIIGFLSYVWTQRKQLKVTGFRIWTWGLTEQQNGIGNLPPPNGLSCLFLLGSASWRHICRRFFFSKFFHTPTNFIFLQ